MCVALHCVLWRFSSPTRQIFEGYFHSLLKILKGKSHTQSESLKGGFEAEQELPLVREYTQNGGFQEP